MEFVVDQILKNDNQESGAEMNECDNQVSTYDSEKFEPRIINECSKKNEKATENYKVELVDVPCTSNIFHDKSNTPNSISEQASEKTIPNLKNINDTDTVIVENVSSVNALSNTSSSEKVATPPVEIENSVSIETYTSERNFCPDPLNVLTQNYENNEPVTYFSGFVNHLTREESIREETDETNCRDLNSEFLVTNLMTNETMNDMFDKVYENKCQNASETYSSNLISNHNSTSHFECMTDKSCEAIIGNSISIKSSLKRPNNEFDSEEGGSPEKKSKKGIKFNSVDVYYFPRIQGFTCIPSQGGSTLGMSWNHSHSRSFSLGEHAAEQRRAHKHFCAQQLSRNWNDISTMSSDDSDSEEMISDSEIDYENFNFLQPIPTRERRAMLRAAGIQKIDSGEKDECRNIRMSREFCGCTCQVYCDPKRCVCAQAGIKCQVDRMNFPCSCSRDGCANQNGRIEFNPVRVRTHYIHTLMRLEMEKKNEEEKKQREKFLLNETGDVSHFSYSSSSAIDGNELMEFNYNNVPGYYHPPMPNEYSELIASAASSSCYNFNYVTSSNQFDLSTNVDNFPHPASMECSSKLTTDNSCSAVQYNSSSISTEVNPPLSQFNDSVEVDENSQNLILHDLSNASKNNDSHITYNNEAFAQLDDNLNQQIDIVSQNNTLGEVNEETEREESDLENFGDIIKKTIVESVTA